MVFQKKNSRRCAKNSTLRNQVTQLGSKNLPNNKPVLKAGFLLCVFTKKICVCFLLIQVEEAPPPAPSPQPALQQIRIVNSDGTVTMGTVGGNQRIVQQQPVQQAQQNIRVLNSDGTITSLNSSNIRLAMQQVSLHISIFTSKLKVHEPIIETS